MAGALLPFIKGEKVFKVFKKEGGLAFFHKKGGIGKIGGCFKREDITYFHAN